MMNLRKIPLFYFYLGLFSVIKMSVICCSFVPVHTFTLLFKNRGLEIIYSMYDSSTQGFYVRQNCISKNNFINIQFTSLCFS